MLPSGSKPLNGINNIADILKQRETVVTDKVVQPVKKEVVYREESPEIKGADLVRYGNRKLYYKKESRYISLDEVLEQALSGKDMNIVDVKSGKDITATTLMKAIAKKLEPIADMVTVQELLSKYRQLLMGPKNAEKS